MPATRDLGKVYAHAVRLARSAPLYHQYPTYEFEHPYRYGNGHVFRAPFSGRGVVVGRWLSSLPEEVATMKAMQGRDLDHFEAVDDDVQGRVRNLGWEIR